MRSNRIKIGITQGDINGISYEVIIKTLLDNRIFDLCIPIVYGSPKVAAYHRKALNIDNFSFNNIKTPREANPKRANMINCISDSVRVELGKSTGIAGEASLKALETAVKDLEENNIDALVTGPINKYNIQSDDFNFAGHTDFLKARFKSDDVLMLMVNELFRVGVVTSHIPLAKVSEHITEESLLSKLSILNNSLLVDFVIRKPRIAILGLNPHTGDNGIIGDEEKKVIMPAIKAARDKDIAVFGPFSADGFFGAGTYRKFDAILAMYHDQGLIPFKAMTYEGGVNYTAGLPVIRTSPSHGTAYELAGKNEAQSHSFRKAIYLACEVYNNRENYKEISGNAMKSEEITES